MGTIGTSDPLRVMIPSNIQWYKTDLSVRIKAYTLIQIYWHRDCKVLDCQCRPYKFTWPSEFDFNALGLELERHFNKIEYNYHAIKLTTLTEKERKNRLDLKKYFETLSYEVAISELNNMSIAHKEEFMEIIKLKQHKQSQEKLSKDSSYYLLRKCFYRNKWFIEVKGETLLDRCEITDQGTTHYELLKRHGITSTNFRYEEIHSNNLWCFTCGDIGQKTCEHTRDFWEDTPCMIM